MFIVKNLTLTHLSLIYGYATSQERSHREEYNSIYSQSVQMHRGGVMAFSVSRYTQEMYYITINLKLR